MIKMADGFEKTFLVLLRWVFGALRMCARRYIDAQQAIGRRFLKSTVGYVPPETAVSCGKLPCKSDLRETCIGKIRLTPSFWYSHQGNRLCEHPAFLFVRQTV